MEFFDFNRLSRPADFNTAISVSFAHPGPSFGRGGLAWVHVTDRWASPRFSPDHSAYRTTLDISPVRETRGVRCVISGG